MTFARYSGAGNTFLIGDNRAGWFDPQMVLPLCRESDVDGVIVAETSLSADMKMRIYNRDGSEAEMCGNGLRCFVRFLEQLGIKKERYSIETLAGVQQGWISPEGVSVRLAPPTDLRLDLPYDLYFINTGVPHAVLFLDRVEDLDIEQVGRALRFSPLFAPAGANINFVCQNPDASLTLRTYERGVEGETLACGTGASAVALIAHKVLKAPSPVTLHVRSGEKLTVTFNDDWSEVILQGPAIFQGALDLKGKIPIMAPL